MSQENIFRDFDSVETFDVFNDDLITGLAGECVSNRNPYVFRVAGTGDHLLLELADRQTVEDEEGALWIPVDALLDHEDHDVADEVKGIKIQIV